MSKVVKATDLKTWLLELECGHLVKEKSAAPPDDARCDVCDPYYLMGIKIPPSARQETGPASTLDCVGLPTDSQVGKATFEVKKR